MADDEVKGTPAASDGDGMDPAFRKKIDSCSRGIRRTLTQSSLARIRHLGQDGNSALMPALTLEYVLKNEPAVAGG
jgi:hypothetical protein